LQLAPYGPTHSTEIRSTATRANKIDSAAKRLTFGVAKGWETPYSFLLKTMIVLNLHYQV
jgi:hypothetical protein